MADAWRPANELESRLAQALRAGDQEGYFRLLAEAELVIPVPPDLLDDVLANQTQPTWPTQEHDGRTYVLAFTSPAAMRAGIGPAYQHFVKLKFRDAADGWPQARWWLAVDVGSPIESRLPSWFLRQLVEGDAMPPQAGLPLAPAAPSRAEAPPQAPADEPAATETPAAEAPAAERAEPAAAKAPPERPAAQRAPEQATPVNKVERELLRAAAEADQDAYFKALVSANVLIPVPEDMDYALRPGRPDFPWQTADLDGTTVLPVFTSGERAREALGDTGGSRGTLTVPFLSVVRYWPDPGWGLVVNSGTSLAAMLPGEQLRNLAEWADRTAAQQAAAGFEPQNDVEQRLFEAAARADQDAFVKVLLGAQVLIPSEPETPWGIRPDDPEFPWRPLPVYGGRAIQVFTSLKWMHEAVGPSRFVMPTMLDLAAAWPESGWTLVVNPGTPIDATIPGDRVRALAGAGPAPARTAGAGPAEQPAEPPAEQPAEPGPNTLTQPVASADAATLAAQPGGPEPEPEPEFEPGNRIDQELYEAAVSGDTDAFLRVLLAANVLVPIPADAPLEVTPVQREFRWEAAMRDASSVQVFTSLVRLREALPASRFVYADFRELIGAWPRADWTMLLNPGTRIGASLRGDQVQALSEWAVRVGLIRPRPQAGPGQAAPPVPLREPAAEPSRSTRPAEPAEPAEAGPSRPAEIAEPIEPTETFAPGDAFAPDEPGEPGERAEPMDQGPRALPRPDEDVYTPPRIPAQPLVMQKVLPHGHVGWYLEQGYDRVGGFVHLVSDVADLQSPIQLYETLGLFYEGSPFTPGDEGVYVIRWPAYGIGLFRIPFGGQSEEELRAWGEAGWVIERPPFAGAGFAPGSAGTIREYKVDSVRLPYGAEMYYLGHDRTERFVAMYDPDRAAWLRPDAGGAGGTNGSRSAGHDAHAGSDAGWDEKAVAQQ